MPLVTTQIEIAASPEKVRAKFLEFSQIPNYTPNGYIRSLAPASPKDPSDIVPGDVMNCVFSYGTKTASPIVLENSPSAFRWMINLHGLFVGEHVFRFEELKKMTAESESGNEAAISSTLFVHEENFSGVLSFLMGDGVVARLLGEREKMREGFVGFNGDFKALVEKS